MRRIEIGFVGIVLGAIPIIVGFLGGWWLSIPFVPESRILTFALAGLAIGGLVDAIWLKSWIRRAYSVPPLIWMGVYLFYSLCLLGFFMGMPVFNVCLSVPAGLFIGAQQAHRGAQPPAVREAAQRAAWFTTGVMALICSASAALALADPYTEASLKAMLGLGFTVTRPMLVGLIVIGGLALLGLQWWLTKSSAEVAYRHLAGA